MAEHLEELYTALYNSQEPGVAEQISQEILSLYEQPDCIGYAFQILSGNNTAMKKRVSIGFKMILKLNIEFLRSGAADEVKANLIQIFSNETDNYTFENLAQSVIPLLQIDENWGDLFTFALSLLSSESIQQIINGLHLFSIILECISPEISTSLCDQIFPLLSHFFEIDNEDIIRLSSKLLEKCFAFNPDIGEALMEPLCQLMTVYNTLVTSGSAKTSSISSISHDISDILGSTYPFEDFTPYLQQFIDIINNEGIAPEYKQYSIDIAVALFTNDITLQEMLPSFLSSVIAFAATSFQESTDFDNQEYLSVVEDNLMVVCQSCSKAAYVESLQQIISEAESPPPPLIYAFVLCYVPIVSEGWEVAMKHSGAILEFAMSLLQFECDDAETTVCIIEAGMELLSALFEYEDPLFQNVQQDVFSCCVSALQTDDVPLLHYKALTTMSAMLCATDLQADLVEPFAEVLEQLSETEDNRLLELVVECLGDLADNAKEQIQPHIEAIMTILVGACQLDQPEDVAVRCAAINSLAEFVPYIEDSSEYIALFIEAITSDDVDIITAGFEALLRSLKHIPSGFEEGFATVIEQLVTILDTNIEYRDSPDEEAENNKMEHIMFAALKFVRKAVQLYPALFADAIEAIAAKIDEQLQNESNVPKIMCQLIESGIVVHQAIDQNISEFLAPLAEEIGEEKYVTCALLNSIAKALFKDAVIDEHVLSAYVELAMPGFSQEFDFLSADNYDSEFYPALCDFFAAVAVKATQAFPFDSFYEVSKSILGEDNQFLKAEVIRVLSTFFEIAHEQLQSLIKKDMLRTFVEALDICESLEVNPDPIIAVRSAIELEPELMANHLEKIFETINGLLEYEAEDTVIYRSTMTSIVSLLFAILKSVMKEDFNFEQYMPLMLNLFPLYDDEADHCYGSLAIVCSDFPQQMGPFGLQVVVALAKTLGLRDHTFQRIAMNNNIFISICVLFQNLVQTLPQATAAIDEALADQPDAQERINARLREAANLVDPQNAEA